MNNIEPEEIIEQVLKLAQEQGVTAAEADVNTGRGLSVAVRMGEVETVEHQRDKGLGITVYMGQCKGSASTTDFSPGALADTVLAACTIASNSNEDRCAGLLEPRYLAKDIPDLDLHHPWDITPERAIELARGCEEAARSSDSRIVNSEGAMLSTYAGRHTYGNSNGFIGGWAWSSHSMDCTLIAAGKDGRMQRDGWYTRCRDYRELDDFNTVGREAGRRAVARLESRRLSTRRVPVVFEAPLASSLFSAFIGAVSGGPQYRKASFLLDKAGAQVFPDFMQISERPHIPKGPGSAPFDNEGMATRDRDLVSDGVLQGYVLSAYSARKLGLPPTGNAGGVHNLMVQPGTENLPGLLSAMGQGLLITDMIGFGVNQVTGDYSRGAAGFWVENGEIQYPVEEITVAGNLAEMYKHISMSGKDVDKRGNIQTGSVLIDGMTVAGE
jgi:PmbA protein